MEAATVEAEIPEYFADPCSGWGSRDSLEFCGEAGLTHHDLALAVALHPNRFDELEMEPADVCSEVKEAKHHLESLRMLIEFAGRHIDLPDGELAVWLREPDPRFDHRRPLTIHPEPDGPNRLLAAMLERFCPDGAPVQNLVAVIDGPSEVRGVTPWRHAEQAGEAEESLDPQGPLRDAPASSHFRRRPTGGTWGSRR